VKALIVVDMQNDFIDGALGTKEAAAIVGNVENRIKSSSGELIIFTQDTHHDNYLSTQEGKKLPVVHCIEGTKGWEINESIMDAWRGNRDTLIIDSLKDNTFTKPVFGSSDLVEYLKSLSREITGIEILGVCTDICVVSNAIMLKNALPEMAISVNSACCAGVTPQTHNQALDVMKMCQIDVF